MSWRRLWRRKLDLSIAVFGILLGIAILVVDTTGKPPISLTDVGLGPTSLPNTMAVLSMVLSLAVALQAARPPVPDASEARTESDAPLGADYSDVGPDDEAAGDGLSPREETLHLLRLSVLFVLYLLGMSYLGFIVSTILFLVVFYRMLRAAGWIKSVVIAVIFTVALYYVFAQVFSIQLPTALLDLLGW